MWAVQLPVRDQCACWTACPHSSLSHMERSSRHDVRNPLAADPEVIELIERLTTEHPAAAVALRGTLKALSAKWRDQAEHAWRKHKGPMAAYHKANAVNARHLSLLLRPIAQPQPAESSKPHQEQLAVTECV